MDAEQSSRSRAATIRFSGEQTTTKSPANRKRKIRKKKKNGEEDGKEPIEEAGRRSLGIQQQAVRAEDGRARASESER
jgi:hypothetical protein